MNKDLIKSNGELKFRAAKKALEFVSDGMAIELGTGSTIAHFINLLGEKISSGKLRDISVVATPSTVRILEHEA